MEHSIASSTNNQSKYVYKSETSSSLIESSHQSVSCQSLQRGKSVFLSNNLYKTTSKMDTLRKIISNTDRINISNI
jgi:hypothetical protein